MHLSNSFLLTRTPCIECKSALADHVEARLRPLREKRAAVGGSAVVRRILDEGAARARESYTTSRRFLRGLPASARS